MPALFFWYVLPFIFLILAVGAGVLWTKTKRLAALAQFIASSFVCLVVAVEVLADKLMWAQKPVLWDALHRSSIEQAGQIAIFICFVIFPVAYLWYALTHKRI